MAPPPNDVMLSVGDAVVVQQDFGRVFIRGSPRPLRAQGARSNIALLLISGWVGLAKVMVREAFDTSHDGYLPLSVAPARYSVTVTVEHDDGEWAWGRKVIAKPEGSLEPCGGALLMRDRAVVLKRILNVSSADML